MSLISYNSPRPPVEKQALSNSCLKQVKAEVCQSEPEVTGTREISCKWLKGVNI